ncbi:ATP-dependent RNA helicase ddx24 [Phytophthora pseudosyringae]|uniref:ATP-dependent RNA helicase n=1 Tax=Phytophthora pseudosyringae TaxID=221518 RepID=A0A8T1VE58_9STRA|nr:ATP-dependent RNA helicase ddx24 [Phytophthora pseudosyringae]
MSGVSVVPYTLAPASAAGAKPSKKRKSRSSSSASAADAGASSSMADGGWAKVDIEDLQLEGFQDGCAFELEELTDYRVEATGDGGKMLVGERKSQQEQGGGKKKKRRKTKAKKKQSEEKPDADAELKEVEPMQKRQKQQFKQEDGDDASRKSKRKKNRGGKARKAQEQVETVALKDVNLPKWNKFKLHPLLMQSLQMSGFAAPTLIQGRTLLPALVDNRDVVGAAPTGSGKTLAFGLPILSQLLHEREQPGYTKDCKALILTPTRELAIQIQQHLEKMVRNREIGVVTLVGGMAVQKQKRILTYRPEIVIGTPGRLWDIIESNHEHMKDLSTTLRFLVVDEADRMLQPGSYPELEKIFDVLRRKNTSASSELSNLSDNEDEDDEEESGGGDDNEGSDEEDDGEDIDMSKFASGTKVMMLDDVLKMQRKQQEKKKKTVVAKENQKAAKVKAMVEVEAVARPRHVRQTFLFSATLTIPEGGRFQKSKTKKFRNALSVLERVMKRVGLRGKPAVVDLGIAEPDMGVPGAKPIMSEEAKRNLKKQHENVALSLPTGLELCQHEVTESTRDTFLYYFLTQYPGRTIIFLNAIHQVRKLTGLLNLLSLPVFALHAEMQQRQRLKKLDGFRSHAKGILVATDVAARGLDIPCVDYVVHYHIARSTEVFVHRSGRTARANKDGLSVSLVSPTDATYHTQICKMLQRPTGLSDFPFDHRYMEAIDERMRLAKSINEQENAAGKLKSEATWFEQMAAAADLDLDEDLLFELGAKQRNQDGKKKKTANQSVQSLRAQLSRLLAAPLRPVGSARKFRQLHKELGSQITGDGEYRARDASEDLASKGKKSYKRFRRRK